MKRLALAIAVILSYSSVAQTNDDPLSMPWLINASISDHKALWVDMGYILERTNYEGCILTYSDEARGLASFIDFSVGWGHVEEVILAARSPETYNMYLEYSIENYKEESSDTKTRTFASKDLKVRITFSTPEYQKGGVYMIRMKAI